MTQMKLTYGMFDSQKSASRAVDALIEAHFDTDEVTVLVRSADLADHEVEQLPVEEHQHGAKGAAIGAVLGAVGGLALMLVGGWAAAGPLFPAVVSAIGAEAVGTSGGLLTGLEWETEDIAFDEEHFPPGAFLVGVLTSERHEAAAEALRDAGAPEVYERTPDLATDQFSHLRRSPESAHG
jgi:hypothetical protein